MAGRAGSRGRTAPEPVRRPPARHLVFVRELDVPAVLLRLAAPPHGCARLPASPPPFSAPAPSPRAGRIRFPYFDSRYMVGVVRTRPSVMSEATYYVLAALLDGPLHGYAVIKRVREQSGGRVDLAVGTLYGALERMADGGLIEVDHEEVVAGRPRRYFRVTDVGSGAVREEAERLAAAAAVVRGRAETPKRAARGAGPAGAAGGAVTA